jgi:hypothetical protein
MRDDIYSLIDAHDYRRRRPRSMLPGCSLIWVYLNREMRREGKDTEKNTLSLAVAGWKLVDRIQFLSKLPEGWRERNREVCAGLFRRLQSRARPDQDELKPSTPKPKK